jgi:DNA-binding CsgD family transcriptional regulator
VKSHVRYLVLILCLTQTLAAQDLAPDPQKWVIELSKKEFYGEENFAGLISTLSRVDSLKAFEFINELEKSKNLDQHYFGARFYCLKASVIFIKILSSRFSQYRKVVDQNKIKAQLIDQYTHALESAYRSEDDGLIAFVSQAYAGAMGAFRETGISSMYAKNAIDLYEKINYPILPQRYQELAELLYQVGEYNKSIFYAQKAILGWTNSTQNPKSNEILTCINTVALGYHRQQKYDSAMFFYNQALELAHRLNHKVWVGIVSGNIGQVFYAKGAYDTAYTLLKRDYELSKNAGGFADAANSLQWAARTNLAMGHKTQALAEVREAIRLLKAWPLAGYFKNTYYTATQIFRELGEYDSAFYYNDLYNRVNDSLEKAMTTSSLTISTARLNEERSRYQIQNLKRDKQSEVIYRNIMIAGIVGISLLSLLLVNRRRLREKFKTESAEREVLWAKEQMRLFTENIVEKTALIEKLEGQAKEASYGQQAVISELSNQTILTEDDWDRFKALFETIYPRFFIKLKQDSATITVAEQRMAALIRLLLTTRQIASMLGISVDSVHKTRQRLRQRLQLASDASLEDRVTAI